LQQVQNESGLLPWQQNTRQRTRERGGLYIQGYGHKKSPGLRVWQQGQAACHDFILPCGPLLTKISWGDFLYNFLHNSLPLLTLRIPMDKILLDQPIRCSHPAQSVIATRSGPGQLLRMMPYKHSIIHPKENKEFT
jgi:hypothetical protein